MSPKAMTSAGAHPVLGAERLECRGLADPGAADLEQHVARVGHVRVVARRSRRRCGGSRRDRRSGCFTSSFATGSRSSTSTSATAVSGAGQVGHVARLVGEAACRTRPRTSPRAARARIASTRRARAHRVQHVLADHLTAAEVVDHRPVRAHRQPGGARLGDDLAHPARRPAGHEDQQGAALPYPIERLARTRRDPSLGVDERAVEVGRRRPSGRGGGLPALTGG